MTVAMLLWRRILTMIELRAGQHNEQFQTLVQLHSSEFDAEREIVWVSNLRLLTGLPKVNISTTIYTRQQLQTFAAASAMGTCSPTH